MHPTSPGKGGWDGSKISGGLVEFGYLGSFLYDYFVLGPLALAKSTHSLFAFFPLVEEVSSNFIAAKFHSSCPNLPAFTTKAPFPTDQITLPCWGKKKNILF